MTVCKTLFWANKSLEMYLQVETVKKEIEMHVVGDSFGYILIRELTPQVKGGLVMPFVTKGMHAASVAELLSGKDKGKYVLFRANRIIKAITNVGTFLFIEPSSILSFVEPGENEEFISSIDVDKEMGKEGWIK
jgi:hypothetical protein